MKLKPCLRSVAAVDVDNLSRGPGGQLRQGVVYVHTCVRVLIIRLVWRRGGHDVLVKIPWLLHVRRLLQHGGVFGVCVRCQCVHALRPLAK